MTKSWIPRIGGFVAILLLAAALAFLQISNAETALLSCLPSYAAIALAALIALGALSARSRADFFCICAAIAFAGYVALRALTSPAPYAARSDLYSVLAALLLYGLIITVLDSSVKRLSLILALLAFAVVHVLVGVIQTGFGANLALTPFLQNLEPNTRATGLYVNPDHLAGLLEVLGIFGLSATCWSRLPKWGKVGIGYLTAICYFGLVLTASRAGYLSAATSLLLFAALSVVTLSAGGTSLLIRFGGIGFTVLAAGLLAAALLVQQNAPLRSRVENIFHDEGRVVLWTAAVDQWKLQPFIGTGGATYRFYGRQFRAPEMQSDPVDVHNDYLQLLAEYGLVGVVFFGLFFFAHTRRGLETFARFGPQRLKAGAWPGSDRLALNIGALCAIAAYVVHSAVDFNLHIPANALLVAFAFGILANPGAIRNSEASQQAGKKSPLLLLGSLAAILLFQSVRLLPNEYYTEEARTALRDEDLPTAISFAEKALSFEKKNPQTFFYLARSLLAVGNSAKTVTERTSYYEQSLEAFEKAHQLSPLDGEYPLDMAFAYDQMNRFREAEWMYWIALSRDPRSSSVQQLYQAHLDSWTNER